MLTEQVKEYCRIDSEENIQPLIDAAKAYLTNAGIPEDENEALYVLAVQMLVAHWYDNRQVVGNEKKLAFGLNGIILQLQNRGSP